MYSDDSHKAGCTNKNEIVAINTSLEKIVDDDVIEVEGKVLYVTPDTKDIDFKGLIAKTAQYFDIGSALSNIKTGVEYVVQVPLKYEKALKRGELFMMENQKNGKM